jgi:bacterioferritin-associated ferredoxin
MVICSCRVVTDRTIHATISAGANTIDEVSLMCSAGSECGGCWPELQRILAECVDVDKNRTEHAA